MVLSVQDKGALIFREEGSQLPTPFQCREMAEIFYDSKHIQHSKKKINRKNNPYVKPSVDMLCRTKYLILPAIPEFIFTHFKVYDNKTVKDPYYWASFRRRRGTSPQSGQAFRKEYTD